MSENKNRKSTKELVDVVIAFCELFSGLKMYPYQEQFARRIIRSVLTNDGNEITALFSRQCILEGELIHTREGDLVKIEDHPDSWVTNENAKVLEIKAKGGYVLKCTANHPVMTDHGWVKAGLLRLNDKIVVLSKWDKHNYNMNPEYYKSCSTESIINNVLMKTGHFNNFPLYEIGEDGEELSLSDIISIAQLEGTHRVYDVTYPNKGWFICNGVKVHNSGKSETVSMVSAGLMVILPKLANMPMFADDSRLQMFKRGVMIGIFAPSQRQAQTTYGKIRNKVEGQRGLEILSDPDFKTGFSTSNGTTVALTNGSFVTAISASDGANIEGESFQIIICEEAQDISDFKIQKSISPMGAAYNATFIKIGTASTKKGDFYHSIQRNKKDFEDKVIRVKNHFEYDYLIVSKYNEKYRKYVEQEKRRLGEKSDAFRLSYCLEWILQRGMFIDIADFEANNVNPDYDIVPYDKTATHVVGIDVGGGSDSTVVTVTEVDWKMPVVLESRTDEETGEEVFYQCYNTYVKAWKEISNTPNFEEQYTEIMHFLSNYKIARVVIDTTKERALADRINANTAYEVVQYVFSSKSKSDLYKNFEREVNSGRVNIPGGEETKKTGEYNRCLAQLQDLEKSWRGSYMVVSHPPTKEGRDDYPDSMALSILGCMNKGFVNEITTTNDRRGFISGRTQNMYLDRNKFTGRRR